ncbi:hypothetical protein [Streptomyces avicenniae]|uniref:hypothetical protein n=1 Tax=Streptomyces avicenniae TaxID=500153 RepID=UPI000AD2D32C|nr:hypothetical protein [Streptomyces avicenniae]
MPELEGPRFLTPAPVREENPHITVITGLEGPLLRQPPPAPAEPEPDGGEEP